MHYRCIAERVPIEIFFRCTQHHTATSTTSRLYPIPLDFHWAPITAMDALRFDSCQLSTMSIFFLQARSLFTIWFSLSLSLFIYPNNFEQFHILFGSKGKKNLSIFTIAPFQFHLYESKNKEYKKENMKYFCEAKKILNSNNENLRKLKIINSSSAANISKLCVQLFSQWK